MVPRATAHHRRRPSAGIPPSRALDIGAGAGGNTRVLEQAGWQATALEFSQAGVELARRRGLDVVQGDARDIPFPDDHFGLLVAYDVLEHIEEDDQVVAEIARVVQPGGKVLIAVPADPRLWSPHDDAVGHVRRYTRDSLVSLFDADALPDRRGPLVERPAPAGGRPAP